MSYLLPHALRNSAARRPHHPAFRCGGEQLSFRETDAWADRIAGQLHDLGVGRGDRVGVYLHRCLATPAVIYSIMRLGAVFVPLNPRAPATRTAFQLADCGATTVVSHPSQRRSLAPVLQELGWELPVLYPTRDEEAAHPPPAPPLVDTDPAYLIYTSGSTGQPKAIVHSHRSGLAFARLMVDTFGLREDDVLGCHAPVYFDVSQLALFGGPLLGATSVIATDAETIFPASLGKLIAATGITVWYSVPLALLQMLAADCPLTEDWSALRWVFYAGEPFPPRALARLMHALPDCRVANLYGPAETNVCTTYVLPGPPEGDNPVPLGTAWANTEVRIVDGELHIRSATLMNGYWQRPDLNARAFHHTEGPDGLPRRWYRSGDLVERGTDGLLHFRGRADHQVKIRGHRVELGAVEAALTAHPEVVEAVVLALPGEDGRRLYALVILTGGGTTVPDSLSGALRRQLPDYARPATIEAVVGFPRTGSGKVDRPTLVRQRTGAVL